MYLLYRMNSILMVAAVLPALVLLVKVYHEDRLEKEPMGLLVLLLILGMLSTVLAFILEKVGFNILNNTVYYYSPLYPIIAYFVIVGFVEEISKYIFLKFGSWKNPEFNCQFDGVVYAVFVSLGFALLENIRYVFSYGLSTALIRAVTAIPGHASFGIFMGIFYGLSKRYERNGNSQTARTYRILAVIVPTLIHGAYDYIAVTSTNSFVFIGFIAVLFVIAYRTISKFSKEDQYI